MTKFLPLTILISELFNLSPPKGKPLGFVGNPLKGFFHAFFFKLAIGNQMGRLGLLASPGILVNGKFFQSEMSFAPFFWGGGGYIILKASEKCPDNKKILVLFKNALLGRGGHGYLSFLSLSTSIPPHP